jgi:hypothetical protein
MDFQRLVMRKGSLSLLLLLLIGTPLSAQEREQTLAVAFNPRSVPTPTEPDYIVALEMADNAGINGAAITHRWSDLEPTAGELDVTRVANDVNILSRMYGYTTLLGIQVLNTTDKETPADLLDVPFDDPHMRERFIALFDAILPHLNENVRFLSIGNEVDIYLAANPDEWETYRTFYHNAATYVHETAPGLQVGVTVTFAGATQHPEEVARLNDVSDVVILTYYPFRDAFRFDNPAAPLEDFPLMVEIAARRPVVLQEVGYASAQLLESSEAEQAEFVVNVFSAWSDVGAAIPFLDFFLLHDLADETCSEFEDYYGLRDEHFHAFLCTLGLRQADGTPKQAWDVFVEQAAQWEEGR